MKKTIRRALSLTLVLCLVMVMAVPALAVTNQYEGKFENYYYVATSTGTTDHFKGHIGSSSPCILKVSVTYDFKSDEGIRSDNVFNSVEKQYETCSELGINDAVYTKLVFRYYMDGIVAYKYTINP